MSITSTSARKTWVGAPWRGSPRLAVVVERDDLQEPAGSVGTDVEITVTLAHYADGVADCVLDVLVGNTVLARVVRDLHPCRLPCSAAAVQVTLRLPIW